MTLTATSVSYTSVVAGQQTLVQQINTPFLAYKTAINALITDLSGVNTTASQAVTGGANNTAQLSALVLRLGGAVSGTWPSQTYTYASEVDTSYKVIRDAFYYYGVPIDATSIQPRFRMSRARKMIKSKIKYIRDNAIPPGSTCILSVYKNTTIIGTIIIQPGDADSTWIDQSGNFALASTYYDFAEGDEIKIVPTTIPVSGSPQNITVILPFEEVVRTV